ncbi:hypothetical protein DKX38_004510 [Salix brachista]|uniref:Uncharacterized protein n=1 Tax=Salix brachista TaxID=2182728 RepID=A0A5N5NDL3_9ROSI|nr:hypothetical protein DKX38_004510 [Salix brachista]
MIINNGRQHLWWSTGSEFKRPYCFEGEAGKIGERESVRDFHVQRAKKQKNNISEEMKVNWRDLLAFDDEIKELSIRVEEFEEMTSRNKIEKEVYESAS